MRALALSAVLVGCGGEKDPADGTTGPTGPAPIAPLSGLEDLLDGVARTDVQPWLGNGTLSCEGSDWRAEVDVKGGSATEVRATTWDLATGAFAGRFDLVDEGDRWTLAATAADVGAPCDAPEGVNLVFVPIDGDLGGEAAGLGTAGIAAACGYSAFPEPNLFYQPMMSSVDSAGWRTAEIYRGATAEGELDPEGGDAWSSTIPDPGWNSSGDMAPVMGMWGEVATNAVGSCVL